MDKFCIREYTLESALSGLKNVQDFNIESLLILFFV